MGQFPNDLGGKVIQRDAGRRECVEAGDVVAPDDDRHETGSYPPLDVLRHLLPEVAVEDRRAAREPRAVVNARERLNAKLVLHIQSTIMLR
jgi:hypothetical protein